MTVKLYNEDCLEGMKRIPDASVDAIICDLPYGVLNRNNHASRWDKQIALEAMWEQYKRIIKPNSPIVLFGQGMFTAKLIMSQPMMWRYNLVWQKDRPSGHLNANRMPLRQHEDILVFYKHLPVYHPQMKPCSPGDRKKYKTIHKRPNNRCYGVMKPTPSRMSDDKYPTSIISIPREYEPGSYYHPTQKPVALMEYLIKTYSDTGSVILDNCMGAGTTAIAAIRSERNFIGFEINRDFFEIAQRRIEEEKNSVQYRQ